MVDSEAAIEAILKEGSLFELTYQGDEGEQTYLVTHKKPHRPSMTPLRGPPVFYFEVVGSENSFKVRLPDLVGLCSVPVETVPEPMLSAVVSSLRTRIQEDPESVLETDIEAALAMIREVTDETYDVLALAYTAIREQEGSIEQLGAPLLSLLHPAPYGVGNMILSEFIVRAEEAPATIEAFVPELISLLENETYAARTLKCLVALAESNPSSVLDAVPAIVAVTETTDDEIREWAVYALSVIAGAHPEEVYPALDILIEAVKIDGEPTRTNALSALGKITHSYPDAAAPVVDELAGLLDAETKRTRNNAVGLLGDIAQQYPEIVIQYAEPIAVRLIDTNIQARINASITLLAAGEADPAAVRAQHEILVQALSDASPEVRANACVLLANAEAPVSIDRLQDLRKNDPNDTVRERARWAVNRLS